MYSNSCVRPSAKWVRARAASGWLAYSLAAAKSKDSACKKGKRQCGLPVFLSVVLRRLEVAGVLAGGRKVERLGLHSALGIIGQKLRRVIRYQSVGARATCQRVPLAYLAAAESTLAASWE